MDASPRPRRDYCGKFCCAHARTARLHCAVRAIFASPAHATRPEPEATLNETSRSPSSHVAAQTNSCAVSSTLKHATVGSLIMHLTLILPIVLILSESWLQSESSEPASRGQLLHPHTQQHTHVRAYARTTCTRTQRMHTQSFKNKLRSRLQIMNPQPLLAIKAEPGSQWLCVPS